MDLNKILAKLKIQELNEMQQASLDAVENSENDIVILSATGSGKTLAYLLPLISLVDSDNSNVQAVVLVPGRELALQSDTVLKNAGSGLRSCCCYGGRAAMDEHRKIREQNPQIVFATPGRLNDHLKKGNISPYTIKYIVIDEFDKCLEMGFRDEMSDIIRKLKGAQRHILLSATDADEIPDFVNMGKTTHLNFLDKDEQVPDRIKLYEIHSPGKDKLDTLQKLLRSFGEESSIVFLNYRDSVERTEEFLRKKGFATSAFHGGLEQKLREDALYKFSNGSTNIFISTDLGSRGLDIPDIDNIVHYHLPLNEESYIHRVGRTARWKAHGESFFILGPDESMPEYINDDVENFDIPENLPDPALPKMVTVYIGKGKKDKISKGDIVGFLCKKGGLEKNEIGRIDVNDRYTYAAISRPKLNQLLKLTRGEKIKGIKTVVEIVK